MASGVYGVAWDGVVNRGKRRRDEMIPQAEKGAVLRGQEIAIASDRVFFEDTFRLVEAKMQSR